MGFIRQYSRRIAAFTLVELLVVIGVIGVLIAILLPALNKARQSAYIVSCASNERQIMQMFQMYATMQKGWLPPINRAGATFNSSVTISGTPVYNPNWWQGWDQILVETVMHGGDRQGDSTEKKLYLAFKCPSDDLIRKVTNYPPRSYAINQSKWAWGLDDSSSNAKEGYKAPWSCGNVNNTSGTFHNGEYVQQAKLSDVPPWIWILGENWGQSSVYSLTNAPTIIPAGNGFSDGVFGTYSFSCMDTSPARFHGTSWGSTKEPGANGGNYAYADGHVEFIKLRDLIVFSPASDVAHGFTKIKDSSGSPTYGDGIHNPFNGRTYSLMDDHWKWRSKH